MNHLLQQNTKKLTEKGFTFIEAILYVSILSLILTALIPFTWDIIETGSQSAIEQEISSNARYISEQIKYQIRNASGINSVSSSSISLSETINALNPTVITWTAPNVTIKQGTGATIQLNSNNTNISNFTFTNNTSGDNATKNISFLFTAQQSYTGARRDFSSSIIIQSSAEVRSN
ncbi:MAG TPA: hypothetical protein VNW29_03870 [Candidatus Sulfotelmatobacter sp.]|nr:hypothetical protein [Candidatus Sulfotelmatobacter sp.]